MIGKTRIDQYVYELFTGTEYVSSIWNSAGSLSWLVILAVNRFKNIFKRSKFSPLTLDT